MDATQPETDISRYAIKNIASPKDDYLAIMAASPSASNSSPNGPGLSSKNGTIRGFQDGEYNVTFDGIPFGDPGSYGHATTSFFPAAVLGGLNIDRGPGTASTIGNATFGGTMALISEPLSDTRGATVSGSYGSGNTYQSGVDLQSGVIDATGGTRILFNYNHTESDGLIKYSGLRQDNYFLKVQQPIFDFAHVSLVSERTTLDWNGFSQPTLAATSRYGYSYANLNNDPKSQQYYKYNTDDRPADFSYLAFDASRYGFRFTNKLYTYGLDDTGQGGAVTTGTTPNSTLLSSGVPGAISTTDYRAWGNIAKLEHDFGSGFTSVTARAGVWYEHTRDDLQQYTVDLTSNVIKSYKIYSSPVSFNLLAHSDNTQSFVEFAWKPLPGLTITPGWKHVDFERSIGGQSSFKPVGTDNSYAVDLGSTSVNYRINTNLAVYAQWAMGFQAPQINTQESPGSAYNTLSPQQTINYQAGIVWKSDRFVADFDGYYINFRNKINALSQPFGTGGGLVTVYTNQGGVIYKGFEAEATYRVGYGLSVTANGSINSGETKGADLQIANAPSSTADFGLLYDRKSIYGSFLTKYVGHRFAGVGQLASGANYTRLPAYSDTDLTIGYRLGKRYRFEFQIDNLFDNRSITEGNGSSSLLTYYYLPSRNFYGTVSVSF